jgi:hypothetical protein
MEECYCHLDLYTIYYIVSLVLYSSDFSQSAILFHRIALLAGSIAYM